MANGFQGAPAVDFYSMLSGLGDTIQKNAAASAKRDAYAAALAPDPATGKVDFGKAILGLAQVDPHAASVLQSVQAHKDSVAQADRAFNHTLARDAVNDQHWTASDRRAAAAEARAAADYENTPDQYAPNPKAATDPSQPKFIDQYAQAKAAGEASGNNGVPEVGLNPAYGVGPDGKPAAIQFSKNGKAVQTQLPDGFSLSKDPIRVDSGTHWTLIDPITRQIISTLPKDIAGAEAAKEEGSAQGVAKVALPQTIATSQQILKTIDDVQNHPGKAYALGMYSKVPTIPGTSQADFRAKASQLQGQTFLQAYQTLRGSGAITDIEGAKGTAALAALDQAQSTEAYDKALNDFKTVVKAGMLRAAAKARGPAAAGAAPPPEAVAALKMDPRRAADFDAYYGAGAADAVLRGVR